jgi:hypothetical protein
MACVGMIPSTSCSGSSVINLREFKRRYFVFTEKLAKEIQDKNTCKIFDDHFVSFRFQLYLFITLGNPSIASHL